MRIYRPAPTRLLPWRIRRGARALALAWLAGALAPSAVSAAGALGSAPIAVSVTSEAHADFARLVFYLSAPVAADAYVLADPDRIVVDLPEVNFQIDPQQGALSLPPPRKGRARDGGGEAGSAGLLRSFRFGLLSPGKSRIVVDLGGPAKILAVRSEKFDMGAESAQNLGPTKLIIEMASENPERFRAAARLGAERHINLTAQTPTPPVAAHSGKPVVVIDPGHGGVDTGAIGGHDAVEKTIVLDFAHALQEKLMASGRYRVVLTRASDTFVALGERTRIARQEGAALFISIHADTLRGAGVRGATVYTVSERASDAEAARVAESENKADAAAGVESKEVASEVNDILFDLTRRETRAFSHVFARTLVDYWKVAATLNKNPRRSAGFVVLKAPDVPSVLLELGYLSSSEDSAALTSPQWRDKASGQVAAAVDAFLSRSQNSGDRRGSGRDAARGKSAFGRSGG